MILVSGLLFFDFDNDGDQDLYWFGSTIGRGEGPGGFLFPSAGRMLRGDGKGNFQDVTVESRLLDIVGVRYDLLGQNFDPKALRIDPIFHENGKGLAHADLNNDGYVDLVATNSSGPVYREFPPIKNHDVIPKPGPIFLWLNGGGSHNWITFRLHGRMAVDGTGTNADWHRCAGLPDGHRCYPRRKIPWFRYRKFGQGRVICLWIVLIWNLA